MKPFWLLLIVTGMLTGCSFYQVDSQQTTMEFYPPKNSAADVQYLETVTGDYEEIGTVTVTTERRQSLEEVLPKMRYEAAMIGGDAITDIQTDATGTWKKITANNLLGNAYIRANYSAKVIRFKQ